MNRIQQLTLVQKEALNLFKKKNSDYGDAFAEYGPVGVLVRMGDKINRLQHITNKQVTLVNTETLRDTLIDLHNYAAMAVMLLDEQTPKTSPIKSKKKKRVVKAKSMQNIHITYPETIQIKQRRPEKIQKILSVGSYKSIYDLGRDDSVEEGMDQWGQYVDISKKKI
jgi:hypothetical protein